MIVRVWGIVNRQEIEFTPVPDRPSYWEGYAPRSKDFYQNLEIWAKNDLGAIGHLKCSIVIKEWSPTTVRLLLAPYSVSLLPDPNEEEKTKLIHTLYSVGLLQNMCKGGVSHD